MGKGSAPAGNTTTQTVNPTAAAQLPFLQDYWSGLQTAYQNNPQSYYPGQTLADFVPTNPALSQGYSDLVATGKSLDDWMRPAANAAWGDLAGGGAGYQSSPAYGGYQSFATGQSGPQQTYRDIGAAAQNSPYPGRIEAYAPQAAAYGAAATQPNVGTNALAQNASGQGMGLNALARTASGYYLNNNPYLDATFGAAAAPVARTYQTATAPTTDAAFSGGGRYGSGAVAGARDTNELNLGRTLDDLSTNIYGGNYARERTAQDAAAGNYTSLINTAGTNYANAINQGYDTGIRGATAAGGLETAASGQYLAGQQLGLSAAQQDAQGQQYGLTGLSNAFNTGNQAKLAAVQAYPQLAQAQLIGPNAEVAGGQGLNAIDQSYRTFQQQQIDDTVKRYNANQAQPWTNLNMYGAGLGAAVPGSSNVTQPYFQNQLSDTLAGLSGGLGIGKSLLGSGGLLGGLGGGAGGASALTPIGASAFDFGAGGGIADAAGTAALASGGQAGLAAAQAAELGSAGGKGAASALPFFAL